MKTWCKIIIDCVVYIASMIGAYVSCYKFVKHIEEIIEN